MFKKLVLSLGLVLGFANVEAVKLVPDCISTRAVAAWAKVPSRTDVKNTLFMKSTSPSEYSYAKIIGEVALAAAVVTFMVPKSRNFVKANTKKAYNKFFAKKDNKVEDKKEENKQEDAQQAE